MTGPAGLASAGPHLTTRRMRCPVPRRAVSSQAKGSPVKAMDAPAPVSTHDIADDPRNDAILIHVEAQFVPRSEAPVSVYGSGLMLGDSVWEGLRLYDGHLPFPGDHLDRLCKAARCIALDIGKYRAEPISEIKKPLQHNDMAADVHVRLLVARGRKRKPFQHLHLSIYGPTNLTIA